MTEEVFPRSCDGVAGRAETGHLLGRIRERIGTRIRREGD